MPQKVERPLSAIRNLCQSRRSVEWQMHAIRTLLAKSQGWIGMVFAVPGVGTGRQRARLAPKVLNWRNRQGETNGSHATCGPTPACVEFQHQFRRRGCWCWGWSCTYFCVADGGFQTDQTRSNLAFIYHDSRLSLKLPAFLN